MPAMPRCTMRASPTAGCGASRAASSKSKGGTVMSVIQSRAVEKYLKALKGKDLIYYPTWEDWLEVGSPYPEVAYDKKGVQTRFNRNGYDWDIHGCVYTPKK